MKSLVPGTATVSVRSRREKTFKGFWFNLVSHARKEGQADFVLKNSRYCFLNILLYMKKTYSNKTTHESQALYPSLSYR